MSANPSRFRQFRSDIRKLIAEIEKHVCRRPGNPDREFDMQREAFEERCERAQRLTDEIAADEQNQWGLRDGDAQRVHDSLRLSLDYFRSDA